MNIEFHDLKTQYRLLKGRVDARIQKVLDHGQYIMGPEIGELEAGLAAYVGAKHCVGVSDGTLAMMIAMMALDIRAGEEVITTPFTFIATGEMIALLGARSPSSSTSTRRPTIWIPPGSSRPSPRAPGRSCR